MQLNRSNQATQGSCSETVSEPTQEVQALDEELKQEFDLNHLVLGEARYS
jgi:hypothetical protein